MDKSPPNIAKVRKMGVEVSTLWQLESCKVRGGGSIHVVQFLTQVDSLIAFLEERQYEYLFITMSRHTCYFNHAKHHSYNQKFALYEQVCKVLSILHMITHS